MVCGDIHTLHNNMEITEIKRRRQSYILSKHNVIDLPTYTFCASHRKHHLHIHIQRAYIFNAVFIIAIIFIILLRAFELLSLDVLL